MTKHSLYAEMYEQYQKGFSLQQVGKMFGMTRQSVFLGFERRGYKMRKKKVLPFLVFNGEKFTLRKNGYYGQTRGDRQLMHIVVWEHHNGKVRDGYDIHHRDRDRSNNIISNLEEIEHAEHARRFATGNNQHSKSKKHS